MSQEGKLPARQKRARRGSIERSLHRVLRGEVRVFVYLISVSYKQKTGLLGHEESKSSHGGRRKESLVLARSSPNLNFLLGK